MRRAIGNMTKADRARFARLQLFGCIACRLLDQPGTPGDIHHLTDCGQQLGHEATICLCPYHHRGYPSSEGWCKGPSLADNKTAFVHTFGTEKQLLAISNTLMDIHPC